MQNPESAKPVKAVWQCKMKVKLEIAIVPICFECKQTFGVRKAAGFSPTLTTLGRLFELRLL